MCPCILTLLTTFLKDQEFLQVLADLHEGYLNNPVAQAEFKEIRAQASILEVNILFVFEVIVFSNDIFLIAGISSTCE